MSIRQLIELKVAINHFRQAVDHLKKRFPKIVDELSVRTSKSVLTKNVLIYNAARNLGTKRQKT